ncbi:helix-turn-helix domain-containing protein [Streptomyces sp. NPDC001443]
MSRDAREWVWEQSTSRGTARLILLSIADRVTDEQCIAWASLTSLMERVNASRSTVREALDRLLDGGELEVLDGLTGPQRSTVYRLPLAAKAVTEVNWKPEDGGSAVPVEELEARPTLRLAALRRYGIRPRAMPESTGKGRRSARPESSTSLPKPAPRRAGNRHSDVPKSSPQNRSEPKVNRRYSSGAAVTSASEWQADPKALAWARQHGHLDRLGEVGLHTADAKWRAHRAGWQPQTAEAWAADWRSWIAREHAPSHARQTSRLHGKDAPTAGITRAEAHTAALLAALGEPTRTEG